MRGEVFGRKKEERVSGTGTTGTGTGSGTALGCVLYRSSFSQYAFFA